MTDREYADRLARLAAAALRKNQPRQYQMSWAEVALSGLHNSAELQYAAACSPSVVLRLIRRLDRLEARHGAPVRRGDPS